MATVVNKNTLEVLASVHTPDYLLDPVWLINPVLPTCDRKYWKYDPVGNVVREMTAPEKVQIDKVAKNQERLAKIFLKMSYLQATDYLDKLVAAGDITAAQKTKLIKAQYPTVPIIPPEEV